MSNPISEFVTKAQPLLLHQNLEPLEGSVVGVEEEHRESCELGSSIPTITAVYNYTRFMIFNLNKNIPIERSFDTLWILNY